MTATPHTPAEVLRAALALFGPEGERWVGHSPNDGEACSATAISEAAYTIGASSTERIQAGRFISRAAEVRDYVSWNDAQLSFAPIKAAFLRAIALAEAEERES